MTLADRVVVMNRGVIQQLGSPREIYDQPANTFVAGFIGSPAMNLVDGEISNGTFRADNIAVSGLPKSVAGKVTIGFRAEDASIASRKAQIEAPVYSMELLGEASMISMKAGGALVAVKAGKDHRAEIGEIVRVAVPASICHLFDHQTGRRITAGS
jgi:multiple sugar transport system ATP-binding protein